MDNSNVRFCDKVLVIGVSCKEKATFGRYISFFIPFFFVRDEG